MLVDHYDSRTRCATYLVAVAKRRTAQQEVHFLGVIRWRLEDFNVPAQT